MSVVEVERAVFRAAARALRSSRQRLPTSATRWGESLKAAAAASNFIAEESLEGAESLIALEVALQAAPRGSSTARLTRTWAGAPPPFVVESDGGGGGDAIDTGLAVVRLCGHHTDLLDTLKGEGLLDAPEPRRRPTAGGLLFCVGDVLRHRFFGRCVVVGWAETCPMGEEWIVGNRIRENLVNGPGQPFYHVLLEDNHVPRCVSEENVSLEADPSAAAFDHCAMPYYFVAHRAPGPPDLTDELRFCYPDDDTARAAPDRDFRTLAEAHAPPYADRPAAASSN